MNKKKTIVFYSERCISCHACETACKTWRGVESGIRWRWVESKENGRFPDTTVVYSSAACRHCEEPACAAVCPVGAIRKMDTGEVLTDRAKCVGCRKCAAACAYGIPQFGKDRKMQKCDFCYEVSPDNMKHPCVRMCPTGALVLK